jgi:hypothetical protein
MVEANWALAVVTLALVGVTWCYAIHTKQLVEETVKTAKLAEQSARYDAIVEMTRLSVEQNWQLWEHRKEVHVPVAPAGLTDEDWAYRLPLLNHLDLVLLAWRGNQAGLVSSEEVASWAAKSKLYMAELRESEIAKRQLHLLWRRGEGFPDEFRQWMFASGILREEDGV